MGVESVRTALRVRFVRRTVMNKIITRSKHFYVSTVSWGDVVLYETTPTGLSKAVVSTQNRIYCFFGSVLIVHKKSSI